MRLILPEHICHCEEEQSDGEAIPSMLFLPPNHQHLILNSKYLEKDLHSGQQQVYDDL
jgi:hypothetical protein